MNAKKMIELLQQHHPHIGETEALLLLNQSKDDFCQDTEIVKNQLLYDIALGSGGNVLKILNVWIGDSGTEIKVPRLQGTLNIKDSV